MRWSQGGDVEGVLLQRQPCRCRFITITTIQDGLAAMYWAKYRNHGDIVSVLEQVLGECDGVYVNDGVYDGVCDGVFSSVRVCVRVW